MYTFGIIGFELEIHLSMNSERKLLFLRIEALTNYADTGLQRFIAASNNKVIQKRSDRLYYFDQLNDLEYVLKILILAKSEYIEKEIEDFKNSGN